MTTAHRPTFDPAKGKEAQRGPAYHQRLLPAHTQLKFRQPGQGGNADKKIRDLRAELLQAEAVYSAKLKGVALSLPDGPSNSEKRKIEDTKEGIKEEGESIESKRIRILEETRDIDADSEQDDERSSEDDSDDDEDETAELQRELEKIKRERAEKRDQEERERAAKDEAKREHDIALGNPLLNPKTDFNVKRRWDDDVVFKNQARGTENKAKKEFVNDLLRSDFHKRFMSKYVR